MQKVKEFIQELRDIANYKSQIKLLNKRIEELKKEPQKLIDKMNLMRVEVRELKRQVKELENANREGHSFKNLQRGAGIREAKKNRYQSQKQIRKKQGGPPKGYDYDEYPYASTKQGGKGAHVEPVLSEENQAVGRDLGQFYKKNNIKENDMFDVKIVD